MKYKCIPDTGEIIIEKGWNIADRKANKEKAVRSFAEIINNETTHGWKFHSMESIAITEKPGCIGALFGRKSETTYFNMLVFSNENDNAISTKKQQTYDRKNSFENNIENEEDVIENNEDYSITNDWRCNKCGTINEVYLPVCKKCGNEYEDTK